MEEMKSLPEIPYLYICIEGNIGAGKSSLATMISRDYNTRLVLEQFEENSFLPKFYEDPEKYAFPLELSFMAERFQQMKDQFSRGDIFHPGIVSDYLFDKSLIFARKTLSYDFLKLFQRLFQIMSSSLPAPSLLVYLFLSPEKLRSNIRKRGRAYEQSISLDYLIQIQESYLDYLKSMKDTRVLLIDSNNLDFVNRRDDYLWVVSQISKDYSKGLHSIIPDSNRGIL